MKRRVSIHHFCLYLLAGLLAACGHGGDDGSPEINDPDTLQNTALDLACEKEGILKENLYTLVYPIYDDSNYQMGIADTSRLRDFYSAWMPYICNGFPDSLGESGIELLVDVVDKTFLNEQGIYVAAADLVGARLLSEHYEDDPRNGPNVTTAIISISPFSGAYGTHIIRNEDEWQYFEERNSAEMKVGIDFDSVTLIGYKHVVAGCWQGGHFTFRELKNVAEHHYELAITTRAYGMCQVGYIKWQWVTIPKLSEDDSVTINETEIVISR